MILDLYFHIGGVMSDHSNGKRPRPGSPDGGKDKPPRQPR